MSNKVNSVNIDSYLFWLRFKDVLVISPIVILVGIFLSMTMFQRFNQLGSGQSFSQFPQDSLTQNIKQVNKSY